MILKGFPFLFFDKFHKNFIFICLERDKSDFMRENFFIHFDKIWFRHLREINIHENISLDEHYTIRVVSTFHLHSNKPPIEPIWTLIFKKSPKRSWVAFTLNNRIHLFLNILIKRYLKVSLIRAFTTMKRLILQSFFPFLKVLYEIFLGIFIFVFILPYQGPIFEYIWKNSLEIEPDSSEENIWLTTTSITPCRSFEKILICQHWTPK